jgi:hypothetical protein
VVPTLAWAGLVVWSAGSYYNHEVVVYRQLIWLVDAARTGLGGFLDQAALNTRSYARTFVSLELLPLAGASLLLAIGCVLPGRSAATTPQDGSAGARAIHRTGCFVVGGCLFLFFWSLGYYRTRLTFSLVPPALCLAAVEVTRLAGADRRLLRRFSWALASAGCLWTAYHAIKYGPFS